MRWRPWLTMGMLLVAMTCGSGCVAVLVGGAAGATAYAYAKGKEKRVYPQSVEEVSAGMEHALADLGLNASSRGDGLGRVLKAKSAAGKDIQIQVKPEGESTSVAVRVGTFGDKELSQRILNHLEASLPLHAPASTIVPEVRAASHAEPAGE